MRNVFFCFWLTLSLCVVAVSFSSCEKEKEKVPTNEKENEKEKENETDKDGNADGENKDEVYPPVVEMFYSEFVETGDVLRIKGNYFVSPKVYFYGEQDEEIEATDVQSSKTEIRVIVPEGVAYSKPVKIVTAAGESISTILFRDKRNMIVDFDERWGRNTSLLEQGSLNWKIDGYTDFSVFGEKFTLPEKGCDGLYGAINQIGYVQDGGYIAYSTADPGNEAKNILGDFITEGIDNLVLKFEIYVPKEHPITGVSATVYITPTNFGGTSDLGRSLTNRTGDACVPGAYWRPYELKIDETDPTAWKANGSKTDFFTDGWMTVAIPLSDFKWNITNYGINLFLESPQGPGIPVGLAYSVSLDPTKCYDFAFAWNAQDGTQGPGSFIAYFDNFRIVPDDGGGAVLDKIGRKIRYY
jgi:hypothetical protein